MKAGLLTIAIIGSVLLAACGSAKNPQHAANVNKSQAIAAKQQHSELPDIAEPEAIPPVELTAAPPAPTVTLPSKKFKAHNIATAPAEPLSEAALAPAPAPVAPLATAPPSNWQPNEAHLIRGYELIVGLKREIGRQPNASEMQKRLQSHMGLSAAQAEQVIALLGTI